MNHENSKERIGFIIDDNLIDNYLLLATISTALPSKLLSAAGVTAVAYNLADELTKKYSVQINNKLILVSLASTVGVMYAALDYALESTFERVPQTKFFFSGVGSAAIAGLLIKVYATLIESMLSKRLLKEVDITSSEVLSELKEMINSGALKNIVVDSIA